MKIAHTQCVPTATSISFYCSRKWKLRARAYVCVCGYALRLVYIVHSVKISAPWLVEKNHYCECSTMYAISILFILYMGKINSTYANDSVLCVLRVQCSVVRLNMHGKSANKYSFPLDPAFLRSKRKNCTPNVSGMCE